MAVRDDSCPGRPLAPGMPDWPGKLDSREVTRVVGNGKPWRPEVKVTGTPDIWVTTALMIEVGSTPPLPVPGRDKEGAWPVGCARVGITVDTKVTGRPDIWVTIDDTTGMTPDGRPPSGGTPTPPVEVGRGSPVPPVGRPESCVVSRVGRPEPEARIVCVVAPICVTPETTFVTAAVTVLTGAPAFGSKLMEPGRFVGREPDPPVKSVEGMAPVGFRVKVVG